MKRYTKLNGSVEDVTIYPSVILGQEMHLQTYLGTYLYETILAQVAAGTITGAYQTLLNDYILRTTAWWTMLELIPSLYVKVDNGGLMIRVSDDTTTISQQDLVREMDSTRQKAHYYTDRLIRYLCANNELFPEYNTCRNGDLKPEREAYSVAGFEISKRRR